MIRSAQNRLEELEDTFIYWIEKDRPDKVKQFLSCGYSVNSCLASKRRRLWDTNCFTVLALASYAGSFGVVDYLLGNGARVNETDKSLCRAPLHWSVASRNFAMTKLLIDAGKFFFFFLEFFISEFNSF